MSSSRGKPIVDSWEDFDDANISPPSPQHVSKVETTTLNHNTNSQNTDWFTSPLASTGPQIKVESSTRSEFVPQIRILNRSKDKNYETNSAPSSRKPIGLSFEEKQRFYAEARRRIMGEAPSDPETSFTETSSLSSEMKSSSSSPCSFANVNNSTSSPHQQKNILRDPVAPDGTKGFGSRR